MAIFDRPLHFLAFRLYPVQVPPTAKTRPHPRLWATDPRLDEDLQKSLQSDGLVPF